MIPPAFFAKIVAGALIPKLVHDGYVYCKETYNNFNFFADEPKKKRDCSPWSPYRKKMVKGLRRNWLEHNKLNPENRMTLLELKNDINHTLGMDKSLRAIARIWEEDEKK